MSKKQVMFEHRNASNQLTFDFDKINLSSYKKITHSIVNHFNLQPIEMLIVGFDEMFQEFTSGNLSIGLEWDNWSGYIIHAKSQEAEPLLREIAKYIDDNY